MESGLDFLEGGPDQTSVPATAFSHVNCTSSGERTLDWGGQGSRVKGDELESILIAVAQLS